MLWRFKPFLSVGWRVYSYLSDGLPEFEIIGGFGLEEKSQKTKAVCGQGRTNGAAPPLGSNLRLLAVRAGLFESRLALTQD